MARKGTNVKSERLFTNLEMDIVNVVGEIYQLQVWEEVLVNVSEGGTVQIRLGVDDDVAARISYGIGEVEVEEPVQLVRTGSGRLELQ